MGWLPFLQRDMDVAGSELPVESCKWEHVTCDPNVSRVSGSWVPDQDWLEIRAEPCAMVGWSGVEVDLAESSGWDIRSRGEHLAPVAIAPG